MADGAELRNAFCLHPVLSTSGPSVLIRVDPWPRKSGRVHPRHRKLARVLPWPTSVLVRVDPWPGKSVLVHPRPGKAERD